MLFGYRSETDRVNEIINRDARSNISDIRFLELEIKKFKCSKRRRDMLTGERYYEGKHDILCQKRMAIGAGGELEEIKNLPNNRIIDNQYKKMVVQKGNYLLGQPILFKTENDNYSSLLKKIFNMQFQLLISNVGENSLNGGISWIYVYYNDSGELTFKRFLAEEILPVWKDIDHTDLEYAIRIYQTTVYEGETEKVAEKVEVYKQDGIYRYELSVDGLVPDQKSFDYYFSVDDQNWNWSKIPLIPFKYNNKEIPLIMMVKSLQDGINKTLSAFENNMEEDARNTILVVVNYDGEDLDQFRRNLATYGAVKIRSTADGKSGDVKTLQIEVNADNYKTILDIFHKKLIENAMGYDAKDDRMMGNANQMNIQSMYNDIDLDANAMEKQYQASFEKLLWFVDTHLYNMGLGDFENEEVEVIFNRDMMMNEGEIIDNLIKVRDLISDETIIGQIPWIDDVKKELDIVEKQRKKELDSYGDNQFQMKEGEGEGDGER